MRVGFRVWYDSNVQKSRWSPFLLISPACAKKAGILDFFPKLHVVFCQKYMNVEHIELIGFSLGFRVSGWGSVFATSMRQPRHVGVFDTRVRAT